MTNQISPSSPPEGVDAEMVIGFEPPPPSVIPFAVTDPAIFILPSVVMDATT
jgi:hypothetical protein